LYNQWYAAHNLSDAILIQRLILKISSKLTPRSRVLLESRKLIGTLVVKKFLAFY
jgi:hypothetical protein